VVCGGGIQTARLKRTRTTAGAPAAELDFFFRENNNPIMKTRRG
jgi:hypothetical protein